MYLGIKIGHNVSPAYVKEISPYVDFFEIHSTKGYGFKFLLDYDMPKTIHIPHFGSRINFANPSRSAKNIEILRWSKELADIMACNKIIFHPELIEDDRCSIEYLANFLKRNHDTRLLVENMPYSSEGYIHLCKSFKETKRLIKIANVGFCLDFSHAAEYAKKTGENLDNLLENFLSLNPGHFHISDTDLYEVFKKNYNEKHLNLGEGNIDIEHMISFVPKDGCVTIETPHDISKHKKEIRLLKAMQNAI